MLSPLSNPTSTPLRPVYLFSPLARTRLKLKSLPLYNSLGQSPGKTKTRASKGLDASAISYSKRIGSLQINNRNRTIANFNALTRPSRQSTRLYVQLPRRNRIYQLINTARAIAISARLYLRAAISAIFLVWTEYYI